MSKDKTEAIDIFEDSIPKSTLGDYERLIISQLINITQTINLCSNDVAIFAPKLERELDALECLLTNMLKETAYMKFKEEDGFNEIKKKLRIKYGSAGFSRVFWNAYLDVLIFRYKKLMEALNINLSTSTEINYSMLEKKRFKK